MINIKVLQSEPSMTKTGKPYKKLTVEAENETRKVNMWSNFPDFANINAESVFSGNMVKDGAYWNLSHDVDKKPSGGNFGAFKTKQIEEFQGKKTESISKFQDNKEFSIRTASTMSGAVALAVAEYKDKTVLDNLDTAVLKWRKFLWNNWNVDPKDLDPTNDNMY